MDPGYSTARKPFPSPESHKESQQLSEIWVIEARFKVTTDAESGWIPQSGLSYGSQEEAERMVEHYKKRNTLSEWRARLYSCAQSH